MKKILSTTAILSILFLATQAKADDEIPIPIPGDAGSSFDSGNQLYPYINLKAASAEGYADNFARNLEIQRKNIMADKTRLYPNIEANGAKISKCFMHKEAFSFKKISDNEYQLTCIAGSKNKVTHVLVYNFHYSYSPAGCDQKAKADFKAFKPSVDMPSLEKYAPFYQDSTFKTCQIQFDDNLQDPSKPIKNPLVQHTTVDSTFLSNQMALRPGLQEYLKESAAEEPAVSTSKKSKDIYSGTLENPLAPAKPEAKEKAD